MFDGEGGFGRVLTIGALALAGAFAAHSCAQKVPADNVLNGTNSLEEGVAACENAYGHAVAHGVGAASRTMVRHYVYRSGKSTGERATDSIAVGLITGAFESGLEKGCIDQARARFSPVAAAAAVNPVAGLSTTGMHCEAVAFDDGTTKICTAADGSTVTFKQNSGMQPASPTYRGASNSY